MARRTKVTAEEQARRDAAWAVIKAGIDAREREWQQELSRMAIVGIERRAAAVA